MERTREREWNEKAENMFLPMPLVVSATVNLALAPLRRIRLLMSVEDDLAEEGVVPTNKDVGAGGSGNRGGFGGAIGCAKFLYQLGGVRAFYRGAALEYGGVVIKYLIQIGVVMPICSRVPLQMQRSYALTTLLHTVVLFFPIAPVQVLIDTIVVNACSDFVRKDSPATGAQRDRSSQPPPPATTEVDGSKFRFRFTGLWEAAKAAWRTLPILPLVNKLMLLDFAGRYISSLFFNKAIGYLYDKLMSDDGKGASDSRAMAVLMRVVPPLVSICYGLLTYPVVNLPFSHFVRVHLHEREAAAKAKAKEEEREYLELRRTSVDNNLNGTSSGANKSFAGSRSVRLSAYPRPEDNEDTLWIDRIVELLCHWDVRDYLYFTYEQWGIRGLYRGYSMQVATITMGVVCGATISAALTQARRTLRHLTRAAAASR